MNRLEAAAAFRKAAGGYSRNIQEAYVELIRCAGVSPQLREDDGPGGDRFSRERFEAACLNLAELLESQACRTEDEMGRYMEKED